MSAHKRTIVAVLSVLIAGCSEEPSGRPRAAAPKAAEPAKAAPAAVEVEATPALEYAYSPVGKRDPFRSILDDAVAERPGDAVQSCGPLCKWELEQFRLVAVISGTSSPLAMVEDPSGKGHIVRRNTYVGKRNGRVTHIRNGELVVTEIFRDQMGRLVTNPVVLKLPQDQKAEAEDQNLLGPEVSE